MPPSKMKLFVGMEEKLLRTLPTDVQGIFENIIGRGICRSLLNIHINVNVFKFYDIIYYSSIYGRR